MEKDIYEVVSDKTGYIFVGEVLITRKTTLREKGKEEYLIEANTRFSVSEVYKGDLDHKIAVRSGNAEDCGCAYAFEPGVEYLVLANKVEKEFVTYYCEFIKPKDEATLEEFKRVNSKIRVRDPRTSE